MARLSAALKQLNDTKQCLLMGIVNVTPDSFSDGGEFFHPEDAVAQVDRLIADGADIVDIGGESTRPGSAEVPAAEQIARIAPVLAHAVDTDVIVSVDTTDPAVARHALDLGVHIVNDVSNLARPALADAVAHYNADLILMHSRVPMSEMPAFSQWPDDAYADVVVEVATEWAKAREQAMIRGVAQNRILFDPGLGFAKNARHSFELLRQLDAFKALDAPIVLGASRKSFIAGLDGSTADERLAGSIAAALAGVERGAQILRVHDVKETKQALDVSAALRQAFGGISKQQVEAEASGDVSA